MSTLTIAEQVENVLNGALSVRGDEAFNLGKAMLIGVKTEGDAVLDINAELAGDADIYDLLTDPKNLRRANPYDTIAILTTGWAAPIESSGGEMGMPSDHPLRRRVRLLMCANLRGVASVLRFSDDQENTLIDEGEAVGPLAIAVQSFVIDSQNNNKPWGEGV